MQLAKNRATGEHSALKIMHLRGCERIEIQDKIREADIMLQLNHPNILSAHDIYAEGDTITIVTDVF